MWQVVNHRVFIEKKDIITNHNDQIGVFDTFKYPLVNRKNKVVAIWTVNNNITHKLSLFQLLDLYKTIHNIPFGLQKFVEYLGIANLFYKNLTHQELLCLLHMGNNPQHKIIAQKLNIKTKTVASHVEHITKKLKNSHITTVLEYIRTHHCSL